MPKIYTDEFKQSALELLSDRMTQKQIRAEPGHLEISSPGLGA